MTTSATFSSGASLLSEFGDNRDNTIVTSRDAAGNILVNGGATPVAGGQPTLANTQLIQVFGQDGNDTISLDETNGALPAAQLFGGNGNDTLTGGSGDDLLFGGAGNDTLLGKGGNDQLFGGDGDDVLIGGVGNDQMFGGAGNDLMIWDPGEGTDVMEGGDGNDTAQVNGGNGAEVFTVSANGSRVRFDRVSPAPFSLDIGTTENLVLHAGGGDDIITAGNGLAGLIQLTLDGGDGNDIITGGDGADTLIGGAGDDVVTGGRGADNAQLGAGNDTFIWNPGDGSDIVDGGDGVDTLQFNGSNGSENMTISAAGGRARLTRDVGGVIMDLNSIEHINLVALGGADTIAVNDLTRTGITQVNIDLGATPGGGGDGQADAVIVNGTNGDDQIQVTGSGTSASVSGLPEQVNIVGAEAANDSLVINGGNGADTINAAGLPAGIIGLTVDGGAGNDAITGSAGNDTLIGGDGNDTIIGGRGADTAQLGNGNDTFIWNPGDGSDAVDGGAGVDALVFNGASVAENIDISANGSHARLSRDVGNVTMDLNSVERVNVAALGGADTITVNDLTGTGVRQVALDLSATPGTGVGDGQQDTVVINATSGDDVINITNHNGVITVSGLATEVTISGVDANDRLVINGLGGNDIVNAAGLGGAMQLVANGGDGNDLLIGGAGNDTLSGGAGNDILIGGGGQDALDGGSGNNVVVNGGAALLRQVMASSLVPAGQGAGATPIADPHASQQPLLATPQHA